MNVLSHLLLASLLFSSGDLGQFNQQLTKADVLSLQDGSFCLGGERFAEISWNKFDLYWQLWDVARAGKGLTPDSPAVQAQDKALGELASMGFRTIRFFGTPHSSEGRRFYTDPQKRDAHFQALDQALELCHKHGLKAVVSLGCGQFAERYKARDENGKLVWVLGDEHERELIADSQSSSRQILYSYLRETITRYRDHPAVLMWEISNEMTNSVDIRPDTKVYHGERKATLGKLATFYDEIAEYIKELDPLRLVVNGGSYLRTSAWNQYQHGTWRTDTNDEHLQAFKLVYGEPALDVIDIHYYALAQDGYQLQEQKLRLKDYVKIVTQELGKPILIGEYGPLPRSKDDEAFWKDHPDWFASYQDKEKAKRLFQKAADDLVNSGAQLAYWWTYSSDRPKDIQNPSRFDVSLARNPELVRIVADANRRLKAKFRTGMKPN